MFGHNVDPSGVSYQDDSVGQLLRAQVKVEH